MQAPLLEGVADRRRDGVGLPRPTSDTVYVPTGCNRVYAFEEATGHRRWRYDAGEPTYSSSAFSQPALTDDVVAVTVWNPSADHFGEGDWLVGLDRDDGTERWSHPLDAAADAVIVGDATGRIRSLDRSTGQVRWRYDDAGPVGDVAVDADSRWVCAFDHTGVVTVLYHDTAEVRDVFCVTDGEHDSCGWLPVHRKATGVDFAPFDSVVVTGPLLGRFRLSD